MNWNSYISKKEKPLSKEQARQLKEIVSNSFDSLISYIEEEQERMRKDMNKSFDELKNKLEQMK